MMTSPTLSKSTPNGRFYVHPRKQSEVPSITNVIGMKDKPALKYWAAKQAAIFAAENIATIEGLNDQAAAIDLIKGAPFRSTKGASERGDAVHGWIDDYVKDKLAGGNGVHPDAETITAAGFTAKNMWRQFGAFVQQYQPEWIMSEFTVWSEKYEYAGTGDWAAKIKGYCVYADTKTGNGVYPEVGLQLAALVNADYMFDTSGNQAALPKYDRCAVLHVRPRFSRLSPLNGIPGCFQAFLGLRNVFEWHVTEADGVIGTAPKVEAKAA